MVTLSGVRVERHLIDNVVTGVPLGLERIPHPDQIINLVVVIDPVEDDVPEFLAGLGALGAPPEPASLSFVQGTPQDRDVCGLETAQLHGDGVDVADEERVVLAGFVGEGCGEVEGGGLGIEAAPPFFAGDVD